jgi:phospholipase C
MQSCELSEMNNGAMDRYVTGASCSSPNNFAIAEESIIKPYHDYAAKYAIADRYFQPIVGASSSNDMYLAVAKYVFTDNTYEPKANGHGCSTNLNTTLYTGQTTIADVLMAGGFTFGTYVQGYRAMVQATLCPLPPSDCNFHLPTLPCDYDPSDIPFEYYSQLTDNPKYMHDYDDLATALSAGTLPSFSYVKALQYHDEHPGYGTLLSAGITWATSTIDAIESSQYKDDTLVLITWDEGGGFYDHVKPPPDNGIDGQQYGTRIPLIAIGPFAKTNYVSHVVMEHSSILKFLEYNFLGTTGQLAGRDTNVANIGSMLDATKTGITVPEN